MRDILNALKGKKTYLVAAALGLLTFAQGMGWINQHTADLAKTVLLGAGFAALRAAVEK